MIDRCELEISPGYEFLEELLRQASFYPMNRYDSLLDAEMVATQRIADALSVSEEAIALFPGGFEALKTFMLIHSGKEVAVPECSFFGYQELSAQTNCDLKVIEWEALLNHEGAKIICLPNNPGGEHHLIEEVPQLGFSFVDATYYFFHQQPEDIKNWQDFSQGKVINISLSKGFGLAGMRTSFCVGEPSLISQLKHSRTPYSVSVLQSLAVALMFDRKWYEFRLLSSNSIISSRLRIMRYLNDMGLSCIDPNSNYVVLDCDFIPKQIKAVTSFKMGVYRITITEENANTLAWIFHHTEQYGGVAST